MTLSVTHTFVTGIADDPTAAAAGEVLPSHWNAGHTLTGLADLTTQVTGILPAANGGTANGFFAVSGPLTTTKTFTLPNASAVILTDNAAVTVAQGGTGAATFTAHGVLVGEGTGAFAALAVGATGTLLAGATGADPAFSATPTLGANGGTGGKITFSGATSGSVALQVAAAAGTGTIFQLPATNGTSGWVLQTDGAGVTSWVASGGGLTVGTTTVTSGTGTRLLYETSGNVVGEISGVTSNGTGLNITANGALSSGTGPALTANGTWITGGSGTTTKPYVLIETTGATSTGWATSGTGLGVNSSSAFTGNLLDLQKDGGSKFSVDATGAVTVGSYVQSGIFLDAGAFFRAGGTGADSTDTFGGAFIGNSSPSTAGYLGFASGSPNNGATLVFFRAADATLQMGKHDAAAPTAQTIQVQSVVAGTSNIAGVDFTLQGSRGTGTGVGGDIVFKAAPAGTTGTAQNAAVEVLRILNAGNVKFTNAANFSANGSVATSITSVGPTGANTTVQEWLTIKNASGTTRYIPCF